MGYRTKPSQQAKTDIFFAKKLNSSNPLALLMPEVNFSVTHLHPDMKNWSDAYDDKNILIHGPKNAPVASSITSLHQHNLINFKYSDMTIKGLDNQPLAGLDNINFLIALNKYHTKLLDQTMEAFSKNQSAPTSPMVLGHSKYQFLFDEVAKLILLSFTSTGLTSTDHTDLSMHNILSAFAYTNFIQIAESKISSNEIKQFLSIKLRRIDRNGGNMFIGEIIENAKNNFCTSTLGLYWLQLLKECKQEMKLFSVNIDTCHLSTVLNDLAFHAPTKMLENWVQESRKTAALKINPQEQFEEIGDIYMPSFG